MNAAPPSAHHHRPAGWRRLIATHLSVGVVASALGFLLFTRVWDWVKDQGRGVSAFDLGLLRFAHAHQAPGLTEAARVFAFLGSPPFLVALGLLGALVGWRFPRTRGAAPHARGTRHGINALSTHARSRLDAAARHRRVRPADRGNKTDLPAGAARPVCAVAA